MEVFYVCVCICSCGGIAALIHYVTYAPGAQQGALFLTTEPMHRAAAPAVNWYRFPHPHPQIVSLKKTDDM